MPKLEKMKKNTKENNQLQFYAILKIELKHTETTFINFLPCWQDTPSKRLDGGKFGRCGYDSCNGQLSRKEHRNESKRVEIFQNDSK